MPLGPIPPESAWISGPAGPHLLSPTHERKTAKVPLCVGSWSPLALSLALPLAQSGLARALALGQGLGTGTRTGRSRALAGAGRALAGARALCGYARQSEKKWRSSLKAEERRLERRINGP